MKQTLNFEALQSLSGHTQPMAVKRWADSLGIKYFASKKGICTTQEALNVALGINSDSQEYDVSIL
jgi:hypothetical protein